MLFSHESRQIEAVGRHATQQKWIRLSGSFTNGIIGFSEIFETPMVCSSNIPTTGRIESVSLICHDLQDHAANGTVSKGPSYG